MKIKIDERAIQEMLKEMPKAAMPEDLAAAIEAATLHAPMPWWQSDLFRERWLPALVGVATALGVLWLSKAQENARPQALLPIASIVRPEPVVRHAALPHQELSNEEKGESRDN